MQHVPARAQNPGSPAGVHHLGQWGISLLSELPEVARAGFRLLSGIFAHPLRYQDGFPVFVRSDCHVEVLAVFAMTAGRSTEW